MAEVSVVIDRVHVGKHNFTVVVLPGTGRSRREKPRRPTHKCRRRPALRIVFSSSARMFTHGRRVLCTIELPPSDNRDKRDSSQLLIETRRRSRARVDGFSKSRSRNKLSLRGFEHFYWYFFVYRVRFVYRIRAHGSNQLPRTGRK